MTQSDSLSRGWVDAGHFTPGNYRVDLFVQGEKVASGFFEITEQKQFRVLTPTTSSSKDKILADMSFKGSREAASSGRPVEYRTEDGHGIYRADPVDYNARTRCHKVHERVWEDGNLVKDQIREVCF